MGSTSDAYNYGGKRERFNQGGFYKEKARFVGKVLETPGWVLFVSALPVRKSAGVEESLRYGFVRKEGEKRTPPLVLSRSPLIICG